MKPLYVFIFLGLCGGLVALNAQTPKTPETTPIPERRVFCVLPIKLVPKVPKEGKPGSLDIVLSVDASSKLEAQTRLFAQFEGGNTLVSNFLFTYPDLPRHNYSFFLDYVKQHPVECEQYEKVACVTR
jgi:hypothetical protein